MKILLIAAVIIIFFLWYINKSESEEELRRKAGLTDEKLEKMRAIFSPLNKDERNIIYFFADVFKEMAKGSPISIMKWMRILDVLALVLGLSKKEIKEFSNSRDLDRQIEVLKGIKEKKPEITDTLLCTCYEIVELSCGEVNGQPAEEVSRQLFTRSFNEIGYTNQEISNCINRSCYFISNFNYGKRI